MHLRSTAAAWAGVFAAGGLALCGAASHAQGAKPAIVYATGVEPVDPAVYAKLPGVKRFRGFYTLPAVDLSPRFPKPGYQEQQGSCVAWSSGYAARSFLNASSLGRPPAGPEDEVSPQYVYSRLHKPDGACSSGISFVQALDLMRDEGAVSLQAYPYDSKTCMLPPPETLRTAASRLRIGGWRAIKRRAPDDPHSPIVLDDVKAQLSNGLPVVFAMPVTPEFMALGPKSAPYTIEHTDGIWHGLALVGYDEDRQAFKFMNSWGSAWGQGGYAWVDYKTFERVAGEAYVLLPPGTVDESRQTPIPQPPPPPAPAPAPVRDIGAELASVVGGVQCAHIAVRAQGGRRVLTGYGGLMDALDKARADAARIDPGAEWRVDYHPWPQCEAELTLDAALPSSPVKLSIADAGGRATSAEPVLLKEDQLFSIAVETGAARPYVHVVYIQHDGTAVELYRGAPAPDRRGRRVAKVGGDGIKGVRYQVQGPFGDEILLAVASSGPLFGPELKAQTTEREFLTTLRARLVQARRDGTAVSAAVLRLRTAPRVVARLGR